MATFVYYGFHDSGHKATGGRNASSKEELRRFLINGGISGFEIFESKTSFVKGGRGIVSSRDLSIFCRQMSVMFFSSITLMEGVMILAEQAENKQLKICLREISELMRKGYKFSDCVNMYEHVFGRYFVNMTLIGEESGTLDSVYERLADYFQKEEGIRKKMRSAVAYPAVLAALMLCILALLVLKVLPIFDELLSNMGGEMPLITTFMINFSQIATDYIVVILFVLLVIVALFMYYKNTESGKLWWDSLKLRTPGIRYIASRSATSTVARSLAILLKSGVQLVNAVEDAAPLLTNKRVEKRFKSVTENVRAGEQLSDALKSVGVFPPLFLKMVMVGQKTGRLDDMLARSAGIFDEEVYEAIERVTGMIEPILIIILSVVVGVILLTVMLPMINIMNAVG
ncbi:MAG: type II secretion system F family protein [Clostridiales bacterium]|jgi:type IV pilus assembly protein PilC|nr:type II secretion system F family protein [Clostridiales bacterium]